VLTSWQFYVLIAVGIVGMVLTQSAFQAGPLRASLPSLTVADPVVSILIGITAFHEHVDQSPLRIAVGVTGALVMGWGVVALASHIADDRDAAPGTVDAHAH
jgi:hypothetical protein